MQPDNSSENLTRLSKPILLVGFICGLLLSVGVLNGDESGRVNLFYLLMVYLVIPLAGAILSVVSLVKGKGLNLARLVSVLPLWSQSQKSMLLRLRQQKLDKYWFFLQSQAAGLAYSVASLMVFFILLLATDINFVWRSTLLNAEQLQPILTVIATPWWFWDIAQPTIELLRNTQDSRLTNSYDNTVNFGQWWAFILATQVVYSFALRGTLFAISSALIRQKTTNKEKNKPITPQKRMEPINETHSYAEVVHTLPCKYTLSNWAAFNHQIVEQLSISPTSVLKTGPGLALEDNASINQTLLVLVKSWEPPMGELHDFLQNQNGVIFPVNLQKNEVVPPETIHLKEWQRFTQSLSNWSIYLPKIMDVEK